MLRTSFLVTPSSCRSKSRFPLTATAAAVQTALTVGLTIGHLTVTTASVYAQSIDQDAIQSRRNYNVTAGPLDRALLNFASEAGVELSMDATLIQGRNSDGLVGRFTVEEGFIALLHGQGLKIVRNASGNYTVQKLMPSGTQSPEAVSTLPPIRVSASADREQETGVVNGYKANYSSASTRTKMLIDETPASIGIITKDLIRDTLARTQMDALEGVSGIARGFTFGRGEAFTVRGFDVNGNSGSFNGLRSNGLPVDGVWAPDWAVVERYEVVKGPASIVGGASTPGGVVNRITKTPQRANFATTEFQAGSFGFYRGMIDANGVLPKNDKIRGRNVFAIEEGGHFVDNTPIRQYTVAPSVEIDLFDRAGKLLLVGMYQHFNGAQYTGYPLSSDGNMLGIPRTRNFGGGAPNGANTQFTGYNGEVHYDHQFIHDIKLSVKGKHSNSNLNDKTIYTYTYGGVPRSGDVYTSGALRKSKFDTYAGEVNLSKELSLFGKKHEILTGADYRNMNENFSRGYGYLPSGDSPLLDNIFNPRNAFQFAIPTDIISREVKLRQIGVFAQAVIRPFDRLTLVLAGRHDFADSTYLDKLSLEQTSKSQSGLTGRAAGTFAVTPWMNVYGGVQQSFQPQPFARTREGNMLEPETGINYETGIKFNLLEDRLRITTAVFRTYRQNVSTRDPDDTRFVIGVGEQRHQGVEADINGEPIPGLNLNANVAFLEAKITKSNEFEGNRPANAPPYVGRLFATYQLQSGPLRGLGFGGGVYYQGEIATTLGINQYNVRAYERVDALLFYRGSKRFDVSLNIRNLLDERYIEMPGVLAWGNGFGAPITALGSIRVFF
ncbi:MAG: TonB-dependent receptor [Nitrosomonas sp.]|nr:MAG: TonB-dependent receptor [Nitrosomonas sp.]